MKIERRETKMKIGYKWHYPQHYLIFYSENFHSYVCKLFDLLKNSSVSLWNSFAYLWAYLHQINLNNLSLAHLWKILKVKHDFLHRNSSYHFPFLFSPINTRKYFLEDIISKITFFKGWFFKSLSHIWFQKDRNHSRK